MLTPDQQTDLIFFFNDYEASVGIHSLFSAMVERAYLFHIEETIPHDYNGILPKATSNPSYTMDLLPLCWSRNIHDKNGGKIARGRKVRNALLEMTESGESEYVTVLFKLYGPPPPNVDWRLFPEPTLAPIASLTYAWDAHKGMLDSMAINDPEREHIFERIMAEAAILRDEAEAAYRAAFSGLS